MQKSLGAALYRKQDGQRRVIPYGSRALSATEWGKSMAMEKITEDIFPKCGRKFQCYSQGVFESVGALQYYSDDSVFCNSCLMSSSSSILNSRRSSVVIIVAPICKTILENKTACNQMRDIRRLCIDLTFVLQIWEGILGFIHNANPSCAKI